MQHIMKIRPAWKNKQGEQGGAIVSLPTSLLREVGVQVGDSLSVSVQDGAVVMKKIVEVTRVQ